MLPISVHRDTRTIFFPSSPPFTQKQQFVHFIVFNLLLNILNYAAKIFFELRKTQLVNSQRFPPRINLARVRKPFSHFLTSADMKPQIWSRGSWTQNLFCFCSLKLQFFKMWKTQVVTLQSLVGTELSNIPNHSKWCWIRIVTAASVMCNVKVM